MNSTNYSYRSVFGSLLLAMLAFGFTACGSEPEAGEREESEATRVVATHSILGDVVQNVGGDGIDFQILVGAGEDPHVFEPNPADSAALSEADLVFENGLEYETWLDDMYDSSSSEARRIVATDNIEPLEGEHHEHGDERHADEESHDHEGEEHGDHEEHGDEHLEHSDDEHSHGDHGNSRSEFDPHVWGDVGNVISMTEVVRDALIESDSANADLYRENASEHIARLQELDASVQERASSIPEENRKLITAHDTFGYFAEAYDFEVAGTAIESFTTEASDPAAGEIAELSDEIQAANVPAIFPETTSNEALMERIANEANVELAPPLYTDALGERGGEAGTYIEMMEHNTSTISEALGE